MSQYLNTVVKTCHLNTVYMQNEKYKIFFILFKLITYETQCKQVQLLLISLQIWFTVHICRHEVNIFHINLRFLCQLILVDMLEGVNL